MKLIKRANKFIEGKVGVIDVKRYGYKVNKVLFRTLFILGLLSMFWVGVSEGFGALQGSAYIECDLDSITNCVNPYYDPFCFDDPFCDQEFLFAGEVIGDKHSWFARNLGSLFFGSFVFVLLLNHFLFNRGYEFKGLDA